MREKKN